MCRRYLLLATSFCVLTLALALNVQATAVDLSTWTTVDYNVTTSGPAGSWSLGAGDTTVTQTVNADPTIFLNGTIQSNYTMEGTFRVGTTTDDDFIGFVFGFQDNSHFYIFDWKAANQDQSGYGLGLEGFSVKKIAAPAASYLTAYDFWRSSGYTYSTILASHFSTTAGWAENVTYAFSLRSEPDSFVVTVKQGSTILWTTTVHDTSYTSGRFGFYNHSQDHVTYQGFQQASLHIQYVDTWGSDATGDGTIGNPFRTIQHAINVAQPLDTISIGPGTYTEVLTLDGKSLILLGRQGAGVTVVDAGSTGNTLTIGSSSTEGSVVRGLHLKGGNQHILNFASGSALVDSCILDTATTWPVRMLPQSVDRLLESNSFISRPDRKYNAILVQPGSISSSTTWPVPDSGFCYLIWTSQVALSNAAAVWTLLPGTVVKLSSPWGTAGITVSAGRLLADGILFTSGHDDDTLGQSCGVATSPAPAQWLSLYLSDGADDGSAITNSTFRYAAPFNPSYPSYWAALVLDHATPIVENCTFIYNNSGGVFVTHENGGNRIRNNTFIGADLCAWPVRLHPGAVDSVVTNNTFIPRVDGAFNAYAIHQGEITESTTWPVPDSGFCYLLWQDYVALSSPSATWTMLPGTIVKMGGYMYQSDIRVMSGQLVADGVIFTSAFDATVAGRTTNTDTPPSPGDWQALHFQNGAGDNSAVLSTEFRYGGGGGYQGALVLENAAPSVGGCTFFRSAVSGLYARYNQAAPAVTGCSFLESSQYGALCVDGALPVFRECTFDGNGLYGLANLFSGDTVDACYNYWGHPSGPYHPTLNRLGLGDPVSDYVNFDPYMMGPSDPPSLTFSPADGFLDDGVFPDTARPTTEFEFRIVYADANDDPPMPGYPKVKIDIDGNGVMDSLIDLTATMWPVDGDTSYVDGREYSFRTYLPESPNIQYAYEAKDAEGLAATTDPEPVGWNAGPYVSNNLVDLEIYAADISFSNPHPDPWEPVGVYASVLSNSPGPLTDVLAYLYIGTDLVDSAIVPTVSPGYSANLFPFTYVFPGDNFYSIRVVIDPHNATGDYNLLNNGAARGLIVGDYVFAGGIDLNVVAPPTAVCGHRTSFDFEAHYYGLGFSDSLPVAGATVTFRVVEMGTSPRTTYTNDYGLGSGTFTAPQDTGQYTLEVILTDYTITRTERTYFSVTCEPPCLNTLSTTNLAIDLCLAPKTYQPFRQTSQICVSAEVRNFADSDYVNVPWIPYLDGAVVGSIQYIDLLPANSTINLPEVQLPGPFTVGTHAASITIDPFQQFDPCVRYDNMTSDLFRVWPDSELVATGAAVSPAYPTVYDDLTLKLTAANTGYFELGPVAASFVNTASGDTLGIVSAPVISARTGIHTFSLAIPPLPQGTYTMRLAVDPRNMISEYDETNNSRTITFNVDSLFPNFRVTSTQFGLTDPEQSSPGPNGLWAEVTNTGSEGASGVLVRFYEDEVQIGADQLIDLPPGASEVVSVGYDLDMDCHTLTVRVDPLNAFLEQSEQDNVASGKVPFEVVVDQLPVCPNLLVPRSMFSECDIHVPEDGSRTIQVWTRIRNIGLLSTPSFSPTLTDTYYEPDEQYVLSSISLTRGDDVLLHRDVTFTPADRGSHTFTVDATVPIAVNECVTGNNTYSGTVTVDTTALRPDLICDVDLNRSCLPLSETALADLTVKNIGNDTSDTTWVHLLRGGVVIDSVHVPLLTSGQSVRLLNDYVVSFPSLGATTVSAFVDPANLVEEHIETNNTDVAAIAVVPDLIDLALTAAAASDYTPDTTQVVHLYATVKNLGGQPLSEPLIVAFRPDDRDTVLYDTLYELEACFDQATAEVSYVFAYVGETCVAVTVDNPNAITEHDEGNNTGNICVTAHPLRPDLAIDAADIAYTDSDPQQGEPVYIDVRVHNDGAVDVPSTTVKVFIGGVRIGGDIVIAVPLGGATVARTTTTWSADRLTAQEIVAIVDSANLIVETSESNNEATICAVPEITFNHTSTCPHWDSDRPVMSTCPVYVPGSVNIRAYLKNTGAMDIAGETWITYYDVFGGDTAWVDSLSFSSLPGHGGTMSRAVTRSYPTNGDAGVHTWTIVIDEGGSIVQCGTSDASSHPLTVVPIDTTQRPPERDLHTRAEYIDISNVHPDIGEFVYITATVYNQGPDSVGGFGVRFLVDEVPLGADIFVEGLSGAGGPNDHVTVAAPAPWEANNLPTPLHVAHVITDPLEAIAETVEDNNEATRAIIVGDIADLAMSLEGDPPSDADCPLIGSLDTLTLFIQNRGLIDASADLQMRQIVPGGDTLILETRPIFVQSLSSGYEDFEVTVNADSVYILFEFVNVEPEDYISDNNSLTVSWPRCCCELRGDFDGSGNINIADLTGFIACLFRGGACPECFIVLDVNNDGKVNVADVTYLIAYLFRGGPAPAPCP